MTESPMWVEKELLVYFLLSICVSVLVVHDRTARAMREDRMRFWKRQTVLVPLQLFSAGLGWLAVHLVRIWF